MDVTVPPATEPSRIFLTGGGPACWGPTWQKSSCDRATKSWLCALRSFLCSAVGRGANTVPVVYAGNVAAGVTAAVDGRGLRRAFNLAQDFRLTQLQAPGGNGPARRR